MGYIAVPATFAKICWIVGEIVTRLRKPRAFQTLNAVTLPFN